MERLPLISNVRGIMLNIISNSNPNRFYHLFYGIIILTVICLTIFLNLQNKFHNCNVFDLYNSSSRNIRNSSGPPYLAYIISSIPARFKFTKSNLNNALPNYFNIKKKQSVPYNDSRINFHSSIQFSSLLLTYVDLWNEIGAKPNAELKENDWIFLFEDDVNIVNITLIERFYQQIYAKWKYKDPQHSLKGIIEQGLKMAKDDGILYFGACGPTYVQNITQVEYTADGLFAFPRGIHFCTHAIAYTKWRARTIWGAFASYMFLHHEVGTDTIARAWQLLRKTFPRLAAGNILWPPGSGHYGFFFQDRGAFLTTIG
ncbi:unnamed protein product [Rotaria sp. Silwood1]|nr:unnamed protein product [Rotaria sp. Silwood1]